MNADKVEKYFQVFFLFAFLLLLLTYCVSVLFSSDSGYRLSFPIVI